jgi:hypothetical protein
MGIYIRELPVETASDGTATLDLRARGRLLAVELDLGTLDPVTVIVTDEPSGRAILEVDAIAADGRWYPSVPLSAAEDGSDLGEHTQPVVTGHLHVAVTDGGDTKAGTIRFVMDR